MHGEIYKHNICRRTMFSWFTATKWLGTWGPEFRHSPALASFPGLPRFLFFGLCSVQYTEVEEHKKRGRPGNTYLDTRWTGPHLNTWTMYYFIIEHALYRQARPQTFTRSRVLRLTGKKLALRFITSVLLIRHQLPYVHLASTKRHSRDRCSQAFPVFRALPLLCIILNANRRTRKRGRPGNEATPA